MIAGNLLYAIVSLMAALVIFFVQVRAISGRLAEFDAQRPSSFFPLRAYLSTNYLKLISYTASMPLTALFIIICWRSKEATIAIVGEFAPRIINSFLPAEFHASVTQTFGEQFTNFTYLSPLFLLCAGLFLFAPYVNVVVTGLQELFIQSLGLDKRIDELTAHSSRAALQSHNNSLEELKSALRKNAHSDLPLREELADGTDFQKSGYFLLYAARERTAEVGLKEALGELLLKLKGIAQHDAPITTPPDWRLVVFAIPVFATFCGLFALLFAYQATPPVQISPTWSPSLIEWVHDPYIAAVQILRYVFCFTIPLYVGFLIYLSRRQDDDSPETIRDCARVACLQQMLLALLFSFTFCFLDSIEAIAGVQASASPRELPYSVVTPKFWFDMITIAIMPSAVFLGWIFARYGLKIRGGTLTGVVVVLSALAPGLQAFGYEWYTGNWRGLYWYWITLGLYITFALMLVGLLDRNGLRSRLGQKGELAA